jgi:hypothetical protein
VPNRDGADELAELIKIERADFAQPRDVDVIPGEGRAKTRPAA